MKQQKMNYSLHKYCVLLLMVFYCFETKAQSLSTYYGNSSNVSSPQELATNKNGELGFFYRSSTGSRIIDIINPNGNKSTILSSTNYIPLSNTATSTMDYDNLGNLYFIDRYTTPYGDIKKVTPYGIVSTFFNNSNLNYNIRGITIDNLGNIYFINTRTSPNTIEKVDQNGIITTLVNNVGYSSIRSLTCDTLGNIYFINVSGGYNINKLDPTGTFTNIVNFNNSYLSFTCDNLGNIYYLNYSSSISIVKVSSSGIIIPYITNNLFNPRYLTSDDNGNLFFLNYVNSRWNIMTVTNPINNCITPNPPTATGASVCSGNTTVLTTSGIGEMKWYDASSGGNLLFTGNGFTTPTINTDITYYVEAYYCNLSSNRTPVTVTKLDPPVAAISGNTTGNDVVSLTASGDGNYLWSGGYAPTQAVNYFTNSGLYTLTVSNSGCSNSTNISVTVNKFGMSKFGKLITDTTYQVTKNGNINADTYLNKHGKMSPSKIDGKLNYKIYTSPASHPSDANSFSIYTDEANKTSSGIYAADLLLDWSISTSLSNVNIAIPNSGDLFSVEVSGYFIPEESGNYLFTCEGDDAVDLFINGVNVANHYGGHGISGLGTHTGTINLVQGTKYTFRARMQENGGGEGLRVFWRKPSQNSGWYINTTELSSF